MTGDLLQQLDAARRVVQQQAVRREPLGHRRGWLDGLMMLDRRDVVGREEHEALGITENAGSIAVAGLELLAPGPHLRDQNRGPLGVLLQPGERRPIRLHPDSNQTQGSSRGFRRPRDHHAEVLPGPMDHVVLQRDP